MTTAINGVELALNIEVSFKLRSTNDRQTWRGQIIGTVGFNVANVYNDILAVHSTMEREVSVKEPVSLTYFLLKCADGAIRPFAVDWVDEGTFGRTDNYTDLSLIVHNVNGVDTANILSTIRDLGFEVTVVVK